MILQCSNISKTFISDPVLSDISFFIEEKEKAAIVGINGCGKSTLLKIIAGELPSDSGLVTVQKGATLGYLAQHQDFEHNNSIYETVMESMSEINGLWEEMKQLEESMKALSGQPLEAAMDRYSRLNDDFENKNGYALVSEVTGVLKGLGFAEADFNKQVNTLSGGQKTRVALASLLLKKPDIIMLDEPTNHLDMEAISWLENYLRNYPGAVIIVAHDRYFLDHIVTKVVEISATRSEVYSGNYSDYAVKKEAKRKELIRLYIKQQAEIAHQEAVIEKLKSFNREKSIKRAESREKALDKIQRIDKPVEESTEMKLKIMPNIESGKDVLSLRSISKAFNSVSLFDDIDIEIKRGERVALIGKNGTGKTTILKMINELVSPDGGEIVLGAKVHIGYYDQEHQVLNPDKTLFEEISDAYPDLDNTKIRNTLAAFLFTGDDVFKYVRELSGGERGRLSLAKLMLSKANFLILDEPTNHLDITSREILEDALNSYSGTVFYVSHDRYFVNKTCTRILELVDKKIISCIGNYDYFLEKRDDLLNASMPERSSIATVDAVPSEAKLDYAQQKAQKAKQKKKENQIQKCEERIEQLEALIAELEEKLNNPAIASNSAELGKISAELEEKNEELLQKMDEWEDLQSE